jgi:hypothetical protein
MTFWQFFQIQVTFDVVIQTSSGHKTETTIIAEIAGVVRHIVVADQISVGTVIGTHALVLEETVTSVVIGLLAGG